MVRHVESLGGWGCKAVGGGRHVESLGGWAWPLEVVP